MIVPSKVGLADRMDDLHAGLSAGQRRGVVSARAFVSEQGVIPVDGTPDTVASRTGAALLTLPVTSLQRQKRGLMLCVTTQGAEVAARGSAMPLSGTN